MKPLPKTNWYSTLNPAMTAHRFAILCAAIFVLTFGRPARALPIERPTQAPLGTTVIPLGASDATFQAAFNRGGTIWIQPGDYSLSTNLFFKTNTYVIGNGAWLHWTNAAALTASNAFLDTTTNFNGNWLTLDNLGWDGGIYPASGWNVAAYYDATHLFPNGFFGDTFWSNRTGLRVEVSGGALIKNCRWKGWSGNGLIALSAQDIASYKYAKLTVTHCMWQSNFVGVMLPGSKFETPGYNNSPSSSWNQITPHYATVSDCVSVGNQMGIAFDASNGTIQGNRCNNDYFGLVMNAMPGSCKVQDNNFNHCTVGGFYTGPGFPEVSGNNFLANATIFATWGGNNITFERNVISDGAITFTNNSIGTIAHNQLFPGDVWGVNITTNYSSGMVVWDNYGMDGQHNDGSVPALTDFANGYSDNTNYSAARFAPPPAGTFKLVPSNSWLFSVSTSGTNALFKIGP